MASTTDVTWHHFVPTPEQALYRPVLLVYHVTYATSPYSWSAAAFPWLIRSSFVQGLTSLQHNFQLVTSEGLVTEYRQRSTISVSLIHAMLPRVHPLFTLYW